MRLAEQGMRARDQGVQILLLTAFKRFLFAFRGLLGQAVEDGVGSHVIRVPLCCVQGSAGRFQVVPGVAARGQAY